MLIILSINRFFCSFIHSFLSYFRNSKYYGKLKNNFRITIYFSYLETSTYFQGFLPIVGSISTLFKYYQLASVKSLNIMKNLTRYFYIKVYVRLILNKRHFFTHTSLYVFYLYLEVTNFSVVIPQNRNIYVIIYF